MWPSATSTVSFQPFSWIVTRVSAGSSVPPRSHARTEGRPSSARTLASLRSYRRVQPVRRSRLSAIVAFQRSAPEDRNCTDRMSPYWSTTRPGRPSASPCTRRTPSLPTARRARSASAVSMRRSKNASSMRSEAWKLQARTRIWDSGL